MIPLYELWAAAAFGYGYVSVGPMAKPETKSE
jgi:hypothetical protein